MVLQSQIAKGKKLIIIIKNTGVLNSNPVRKDDSGFGLANTKKRLKLLYGDRASFFIIQESKNTVSAKIELPLN